MNGRGEWNVVGPGWEGHYTASVIGVSLHRDWLRDVAVRLKRAVFRQPSPSDLPARIDAAPMAYRIGDREYLVIGADVAPESASGGDVLYAFALPTSQPAEP